MTPAQTTRRALYGRAKGKALRAHQAELMRELAPRLAVDLAALRGGRLFAPERELWLEIGFGGGEHLLARAAENPDVGFIGCEPFVNGVAKLLAGIEASGLDNIRVHTDDALALLDAVPDAAFARIYLLYPDPWPKRRQQKRRFVSERNIAALARVLRPGGQLRFATDIDDYAGWTLRRFLASPQFVWEARTADDWRQPWEGWAPTRYEAKARTAGRGSAYLTFRRK
ncbi:MAG: tRNA (guanosine(46)-N7)-methyltransferase TrmB [Pseudomonadota bacterium]|nr:tRNA (guanosine(46)-N7)-methyltransferase TrmB [Pseudomonadota bacterium]